jgi:GTP-binding protein
MIDKVIIVIKAGDGGDGAISFRHEKFVPFGGPNGGDGGDGGDVAVIADSNVTDLRVFKKNRLYKAGNGENGKGWKKHGKNGEELCLKVPVGTITREEKADGEHLTLADCNENGKKFTILKGGRGGIGNTHYATSTNQAPVIAQKGERGEEKSIVLEIRLIADVGIIGYPNVGKSTLLTAASAAKPKIDSYPFTTLEPALGVVEVGNDTFTMAEIPGLIDGAHMGKGLGHEFLRHIMRIRILIHLLDGASVSPEEDMMRVNTELSLYDSSLANKPQLVVLNKSDLPEVQVKLPEIRDNFKNAGINLLAISAFTGEGVNGLMKETMRLLQKVIAETKEVEKTEKVIFRPKPREGDISILKEKGVYILKALGIECIIARVDMNNPVVRSQVFTQISRSGGKKALEKAGIKPGDKVRCGDYEWEW